MCRLGEEGQRVCMDAVVPELAEGEHVVIMAELEDGPLAENIEALNEYHWAGSGPTLWVLSSAEGDERFQFQFSHGAAFEVLETPEPMMTPLYRTLPRSFLMEDGKVLETWSGMPPVESFLTDRGHPDQPSKD